MLALYARRQEIQAALSQSRPIPIVMSTNRCVRAVRSLSVLDNSHSYHHRESDTRDVPLMCLQSDSAPRKYVNYQVVSAEREGFELSLVEGLTVQFQRVTIL